MSNDVFGIQTDGLFEGFDISSALKQTTQSIKQSVSGFTNQTVNPIKSAIGDLQSGIALVKDTDKQLAAQLNAYKSGTIDTINNYLSDLTGGKLSIADFGNIVSIKDGFKVDADELVRMAGNTLGFNIGSISSIKSDLTNAFLSELSEMTVGLSDGLFMSDGGKITIASDWEKSIGDSVFNFLSSSSDTFTTVHNFAASNAVLNTMLKQNASIGFVQGYSAFKDLYLYESDYQAALIDTIPTLLTKGDVNSLKEILTILNDNSLYVVRSKYPTFAETVLSTFKLPDNTLVEDYDNYKDILIEIITKVNGTNWDKLYTFMGWCLNLGLVSSITDDSKLVLQRDSELAVLMCASNVLTQESAVDLFKRDFPDAVTL